jgi:hypothetical protein
MLTRITGAWLALAFLFVGCGDEVGLGKVIPEIELSQDWDGDGVAEALPDDPQQTTDHLIDFGQVVLRQRAVRAVVITNNSDARGDLSWDAEAGIRLLEGTSPDFYLDRPPLNQLAPGESTALVVHYIPLEKETDAGTVVVETNDPDRGRIDIRLTGEGVVPDVQVCLIDPGSGDELCNDAVAPANLMIDFGMRDLSDPAERKFVVRNLGDFRLTLPGDAGRGGVDFGAGTGTEFSLQPASWIGSLEPFGSQEFSVVYSPFDGGADEGSVEVKSDDPDEPAVAIDLVGNGLAPKICPQPPFLVDFGTVLVGTTAERSYRFTSCGNQDLVVTELNLETAPHGFYSFTTPITTPLTLPPGDFFDVALTYAPQSSGTHEGILWIISNDPNAGQGFIDLLGRATTAECDVNVVPASVNFGTVAMGGIYDETISIQNTGGADCSIESIDGPAGSTDFSLPGLPPTPLVIPPGEMRPFSVRYQPMDAGADTGTVTVVVPDDPDESQVVINLSGEVGNLCGNGALDVGEYCDTAIPAATWGACPSSCPQDTACTTYLLTGSGCKARCDEHHKGAVDGDGCCPGPEYSGLDSDCEDPNPCQTKPFNAQVLWTWDDAPLGLIAPMATTPLVLQLTDDNSDGQIDENDIPDVFMILMGISGGVVPEGLPCVMAAVSGDDGHTIFVEDCNQHKISSMATPAAADIDDDGVVEIIAVQLDEDDRVCALVALEHDGSLKWVSDPIQGGQIMEMAGGPTLGDLHGDGSVEITFGPRVFDRDGRILWQYPSQNQNADIIATFSVFADLAPNPGLEILEGGTLYSAVGEILWEYHDVGFPYTVVADCDGDGLAEVLLVGQTQTVLLNADGTVKAGPRITPSVSPPAAGDINGDGLAEFVIPGRIHLTALDCSLNQVMDATVIDASGSCAAVLFDFDGDLAQEIVFADEYKLRVIDGRTGNQLYDYPRTSATGTDSPAIADINNDGQAEIVVPLGQRFGDKGVVTLKTAADPWLDAPAIWNQHAFNPMHIEEDGHLPSPAPFWFTFNAMRAQLAIGTGVCGP